MHAAFYIELCTVCCMTKQCVCTCSTAGHEAMTFLGSAVYSGTKFAVTALTAALHKELREIKSNIKITVRIK